MNIPGNCSAWNGFQTYHFPLPETNFGCTIAVPKQEIPGRPWIWRTRFFGAFPSVDLALLDAGYHVAEITVDDNDGSPEALARFDKFYAYLTGALGFNRKVVVEGFSRGGLGAFRWSCRNTDKVACIYADAPVCDMKSWPGGKFSGPGDPRSWTLYNTAYGFKNEVEALAFDEQPLDFKVIRPLAAAKIPVFAVVGDADEVVPLSENMAIFEARFKEAGGQIEVIHKPDCLHHPHSLENPAPVVVFIRRHYF